MYGYFQPSYAHLSTEERKVFNSYYCRLCYCLWNVGGQIARPFTSFDVTVYSMVLNLAIGGKTPPPARCQKLKRDLMRQFSTDELGIKLASLIFIALGEKLRDDILDENSFKAKVVNFILKKQITKSQEMDPYSAKVARYSTTTIDEKQNAGEDLDDILNVYGDMLADLFEGFATFDKKYRDVFFYLGKWTFFIDMLCDYKEDYKEGKYNFFKTEGLPTLKDYFNVHYAFLIQKNREIGGGLLNALRAIDDGSTDYNAMEKVVRHAVEHIIPDIIDGKEVQYNYFKAQSEQACRTICRKKKSNFD